jgi:hypothetical protein
MIALWSRRKQKARGSDPAGGSEGGSGSPQGTGGAQIADEALDRGLQEKIPAVACAEQCDPRDGELARYIVRGIRPEPMPSFIGPVEGPVEGRIGIACSGGGIRSAAFNLGALQALGAKRIKKTDYIAAVSGGSYIAAALAMVCKRWGSPTRPPESEYAYEDSDPAALDRVEAFAPGSPEEQYLRNRSSYLAPSGSDKLFLGVRVVLGLLWNLLFLSLPLFALGMLGGALLFRSSDQCGTQRCEAVIHRGFWIAAVALAGVGLGLAVLGLLRRSPTDHNRQILQTWSTRLLLIGAAAALLLLVVPALVNAFHGHAADSQSGSPSTGTQITGAGGIAGLVAGVLAYLQRAFSSTKTLTEEAGKWRNRFAGLNARLQKLAVLAAGALLGPLLLFSVLVFGASIALAHASKNGVENGVGWVAIGAGGAFLISYYGADVTSWSLHPFYKRRLASAFALKRVRAGKLEEKEKDRIQLVPPVEDEAEDIGAALERDYDRLVPLSATHQPGWPTLVVCAAANISNPGATPPGRNVTSFTFSASSIGGPQIGGASTREYEAAIGSGKPTLWARAVAAMTRNKALLQSRRQRDLTLPAAVAMSGAAVSPSMGKMTSRPLRFLVALANVRLGVWLPNPRWVLLKEEEVRAKRGAAAVTKKRKRRLKAFGRPRPSYLIKELLGRNRIDDRYLYITDGGHYENLALVELLRRGCTRIYCFDASGGKSFKELGDAIALARSELGVKIRIDPRPLAADEEEVAERDTVRGTFTYADGTAGTLVYAHNVLTNPSKTPDLGDAPWDVHAYHAADPNFPHNSTVDQLYTDQKFEGYRVLGEVAGKRAVALMEEKHPEMEPDPAP